MTKIKATKRNSYHVGNLTLQLLDAARELLEEVGPTKLSLRSVSERIGVSPSAAYHHYSNKAELIQQLASQGFLELRRAISEYDYSPDVNQQMRNMAFSYLNFAGNNPALYQLMFGPEFSDGEISQELQESKLEAFNQLRRHIANVRNLDIRSKSVWGSALAAWSYIHGLASLVIHGTVALPASATDSSLIDATFDGLEALFYSDEIRG